MPVIIQVNSEESKFIFFSDDKEDVKFVMLKLLIEFSKTKQIKYSIIMLESFAINCYQCYFLETI